MPRFSDVGNVRHVALYLRVSTRHQAEDGYSLQTQEEDLVALASANGWSYEVYREPGRSGESLSGRPALTSLLVDVRDGCLDAVLTRDPSRLGRDNYVLALVYKTLRESGVPIVTLEGVLDLRSPDEMFVSTVVGAAAAYEQQLRTAKMKRGQQAAAEAGSWVGGPPPFGYRSVRDGNIVRLEPEPSEVAIVERATHLIVDCGSSTWETARLLNQQGMGPRRASRWRHQNLRRTLASESLTGHLVWGRGKPQPFVFEVEPILPAGRFRALQRALAASSVPRRHEGHEYPFTGFLRGRCGARYYGTYRKDRGGGIRQYRCHGNHAFADQRCQDRWRPNADGLEMAVWSEISTLFSADNLNAAAADWLRRCQENSRPDVMALQEEVDRLERALGTTIAELAGEGLDAAAISSASDALHNRLHRARARLDRERGRAFNDGSRMDEHAAELAARAAERIGRLSYDEQRRFLILLKVDMRVVREGGRREPGAVEVKGVVPSALLTRWVGARTDASEPRTSPTTMWSGLIASTNFTKSRSDTSAVPSMPGGRAS